MCLTNSLKMPITPWIWNCRPIPHSNAPKAMPKSHLRLSDQLCQLSVAVQSRPWRPNPRVDHPLPKLPSLKHHKLEKPCLLSPSTTDLCIQIDTHTHTYIYIYICIHRYILGLLWVEISRWLQQHLELPKVPPLWSDAVWCLIPPRAGDSMQFSFKSWQVRAKLDTKLRKTATAMQLLIIPVARMATFDNYLT